MGTALLTPDRDPEPVRSSLHPGSEATQTLEAVEKQHILTVLKQTGGVIEGLHGAARILNLHPNTLRSRMKKLGIKRLAHDIS
jgi:transcriptional regulator with GAF, ATPase, and Fis domain